MRILFVVYKYLGHGGAEVSTLNLARELSLMGHEIIFVSTEKYEGFKTYIYEKFSFPFIFQLYNKNLELFILKVMEKEKIDIVHAHHRMNQVAAIKAAKRMKIPVVAHFRDQWFCCPRSSCLTPNNKQYRICNYGIILRYYPKRRWIWDLYKWFTIKKSWKTLRKADAKIAVSNLVKEKLNLCGIRNNIHIVNNSRDIKNFSKFKKGNFRRKYNLKDMVVLFVGNMSYIRGVMNLVKVAGKIIKKFDNISFVFVGDGDMKKVAEDFVKIKGLKDSIKFTGKLDIDKVPKAYVNADILVFPSLIEEPFSGVLVEAMAAGIPVLASNYGGNKEAVVDGKNGFLMDPTNFKEFENKLTLLLKDDLLRRKMSRFGKKHAENFSNEAIAEKVDKIYSLIKTTVKPQ